VAWLKAERGHLATYRDFPRYENITGHAISAHLRRKWQAAELESEVLLARKSPMDELIFQCLMTINRYEETPELLETLKTSSVVCDRYWPSGYVYGEANGLPAKFLETIHAQLPQPDVCLLLDVPVSESFRRRPERRDRYEKQISMLESVRAGYLTLFRRKGWHVIDATGNFNEVSARIYECFPQAMFS
jgi:thymidylate kinase